MTRTHRSITNALLVGAVCVAACSKASESKAPKAAADEAAVPTNRVDIPDAVRRNLGITFAKAERRVVARSVRYPGRFESPPDARRKYHAPAGGRVELVVRQFDRVSAGAPLFRLESPRVRELRREISGARSAEAEAEARLSGLPDYLKAHRVHETALEATVALWMERISRLEALQGAGGGRMDELAAARAALAQARASLAETLEKDAELASNERELTASKNGAASRAALLDDELRALVGVEASANGAAGLTIVAAADGVVETVAVSDGAWVDASALVVTVLNPSLVRLRASAPQGDLHRLNDGMAAMIAAPTADAAGWTPFAATLRLGLTADPDARRLDLFATPSAAPPAWARAGIVASLEVSEKGAEAELAIPRAAVLRDGLTDVFFRRDPKDPDRAIRVEADLGADDGRFVAVKSGLREGDEVVSSGAFQLLLATSGSIQPGGHFHADGSYHAGPHDGEGK